MRPRNVEISISQCMLLLCDVCLWNVLRSALRSRQALLTSWNTTAAVIRLRSIWGLGALVSLVLVTGNKQTGISRKRGNRTGNVFAYAGLTIGLIGREGSGKWLGLIKKKRAKHKRIKIKA